MWQLAYNEKAALLKDSNGEYWILTSDFKKFECFNQQSKEYNALNALGHFEERFGPATFKREDIAQK